MGFFENDIIITFTIASGNQESDAQDMDAFRGGLLIFPATFDGTQVSVLHNDGEGDYLAVGDQFGNPLEISATNRIAYLLPSDFANLGDIKLKSDVSETGDRTLKMVARPY